jgi:hypothetical protein
MSKQKDLLMLAIESKRFAIMQATARNQHELTQRLVAEFDALELSVVEVH